MTRHWLALLILFSFRAHAATFIGNGGNASDLDLAITMAEIHDTFEGLEEDTSQLCRCPDELAENDLCGVLRALNASQLKLCQRTMWQKRNEMMSLASSASSIKFQWSRDELTAQWEDGSRHVVDAIVQREKRKIMVHRQRFLAMPASFRIALMAHEFFHLVPMDQTYVDDLKPVGPFKDGRSFLDVLGAATAMAANEQGVVADFAHLAHISRAYKPFLVQLDVKAIIHAKKAARHLLKEEGSQGTSLNFEYKPSQFGWRLGVEGVSHASKFQQEVSVEETMTLYSLGMGYHWFPVHAALSRWSQWHVSLFVDGILGVAHYHVSDDAVSLKSQAKVQGAQATVQMHVPIVYGFWGVLGYQVRSLRYRYKELNIDTNDLQQVLFLGGAYAF